MNLHKTIFCLTLGLCASPAVADDWGYDGMLEPIAPEAPLEAQKAPPAQSLKQRSVAALPGAIIASPKNSAAGNLTKTAVKKPVPAVGPSSVSTTAASAKAAPAAPVAPGLRKSELAKDAAGAGVDRKKQAELLWLHLFQGISKQTLSTAEQRRIEAYLHGKLELGGKTADEVFAILKFWPQVSSAIDSKPELENAYADLFRALLRIRERNIERLDVPNSDLHSDSDLITELLGMERLAVSGDPPFAEDAVNAYADMACFVYEQSHPGKTVDASDNRALFARVVADKFRTAPGDAEKRAMSRFDLSWAKFRIVWEGSDEATRKELLLKLSKSGAASTLAVRRDPVLENTLASWPWPIKP